MDAGRPRAQSLNGRHPGIWIAAALVGGAAVAAFGFGVRAGEMRDFEVYWTAALRASAGEPLYRASDEHYQFKYLPAFAVLATPLAMVPLDAAKSGWFVCSVALIPTLLALSLGVLPERRRPAWFLVAVLVITFAKFFGHELVLGQVNLLFAVLSCAGILQLRRNRDAVAGLLFTAAVVVKPYAVVFLPWLAALGRGGALVAAGVAGLVILAVPLPRYGFDGTLDLHRAWWDTVTASTAPNLTNPDNVSIAAFHAKWLGTGPTASVAATVTGGILLALAALVVWRGRGLAAREVLEGALLLTLIPLLSPQGWDYVFLVAAPAVALFANEAGRIPPPLRWTTWGALATVGLSLFDLMGRQRYAAFMSWSVITVCFVVLVCALASLRLRRVA